jgi:nitrile hydratase
VNPGYRIGAPVRVKTGETPYHCRTPRYVRGKRGRIERICGAFRNPESLAHGGDGRPERTLYRVRFAQRELWLDYAGSPGDAVEVEIYEHWLEADA